MDAATVKQFLPYLDDDKAALVADLCEGRLEIDPHDVDSRFPKTASWVSQCHNYPSQQELVMAALDDVLDGHGVEAIFDPNDSSNLIGTYINQGDTYDGTIVYDHEEEQYVLTTWGDWYEGWLAEQNEENNTVQCGWCSHLTPFEVKEEDDPDNEGDPDWRRVRCEQCGNFVNGDEG